MTQQLIVDIGISAEEFSKLYAGAVQDVVARARDGRKVRFPANILRQFVTHTGIEGSFLIQFDQNNRFQSITRL